MTSESKLIFLADTTAHTITVRKKFAGSRQLVWDCHTKKEYLDRWFAPEPLTTKTKHMDFRPGGYWHYAMIEPQGQEYWSRIDYLTIAPIDGYTALDGFTDETGTVNPDMPRSTWDVSFSDAGGHTLVQTVITYKSAEDLDKVIAMGMEAGLISTLERLDKLLLTL